MLRRFVDGPPGSGGPHGISRGPLVVDGRRGTGSGWSGVHGGVKFYRGAANAARAYVERDRSRADDYYLAEGTGVATRLVATPDGGVDAAGAMDGDTYEQWVAGYRRRDRARRRAGSARTRTGLRFVEVVVNGPKTWSLAAAAAPGDRRRATTRPRTGPPTRSSAGSPSTPPPGSGRGADRSRSRSSSSRPRWCGTTRRVPGTRTVTSTCRSTPGSSPPARGVGCTRSGSSTASRRSTGSGTPRSRDPEFRAVLAAHGYTLDPETSEIRQLTPYAGAFSARAAQIRRNIDRYEAAVAQRASRRGARTDGCGEAWDRRAWAQARPDKVVPRERRRARGAVERGAARPRLPRPRLPRCGIAATRSGGSTGTRSPTWSSRILGAQRSAWNTADIRGEVERIIARPSLVADPAVRVELAEDLTARAVDRCVPLLARTTCPSTSAR